MKSLFYIFFLLFLFINFANADSLKQSVTKALINNPSILANIENQKAFDLYVDDREGSYLPTLDIESYLESSELNNDRVSDATDGEWTRQNGYNAAIVFRQFIYDGGITPSRVAEARAFTEANKYSVYNTIENTILETINVYNNLVLSEEKIILTNNMIKVNEDNLIIAKENEEISGEVLETFQVASKLHFVEDTLLQDQDAENEAFASYERFVGSSLNGRVCRPIIDESQIPKTLEESIKLGILSNYQIKEQIARIKEQRELIAQSNANFLPVIDIELKASIDEDLILSEDGISKNNYARLNLNWNLFNGNRDAIVSQQEKLFLNEQKKQLEDITNEIVADIKTLFAKNDFYKRRIDYLKKYVNANLNIAEIYNEQFSAGTRTFIDILNAQSELYQSTRTLLDVEFLWINNYFDMLLAFSKLSDTVLKSANQNCELTQPKVIEYIPVKKEVEDEAELEDLLLDLGDSSENELIEDSLESIDTSKEELIEQNFQNLFEEDSKENEDENLNEIIDTQEETIPVPKTDSIDQELRNSNDETIESNIEAENDEEQINNFINEMQQRLREPSDIDIESLKKELQIKRETNDTQIKIALGIENLLQSEEEYYTINLATLDTLEDGIGFIEEFDIKKDAIMFEFGKDKKHTKILYGVFKDYSEAEAEILNFNETLVKNRPIIKKVKKYQKLFEKYHN